MVNLRIYARSVMNPKLRLLQPYPSEKLRALLAPAPPPPAGLPHVNLSIGEPKHATPALVNEAITNHLSGLSAYPPTKGDALLRETIAAWIGRRYDMPAPDAQSQV